MNKTTNIQLKMRENFIFRLTKLLLLFILADAAYILGVVVRMTENTSLAAQMYHTVPMMVEHVLAAVVLYLIGMVLIRKSMQN